VKRWQRSARRETGAWSENATSPAEPATARRAM
jgi:hypothetical protein